PGAAAITALSGATFGLLLGVIGHLYPEGMRPAFWFVGASLVPGGLAFLGESVLVSQGRLARAAAINIGGRVARTAIWMLLVVLGFGMTALFLALAILRVLTAAAYYRGHDLRPILRVHHCQRRVVTDLLRLSPTFLSILILTAGISRLDFIML